MASNLITTIRVTSARHTVSDCIRGYRIEDCSGIYHWC